MKKTGKGRRGRRRRRKRRRRRQEEEEKRRRWGRVRQMLILRFWRYILYDIARCYIFLWCSVENAGSGYVEASCNASSETATFVLHLTKSIKHISDVQWVASESTEWVNNKCFNHVTENATFKVQIHFSHESLSDHGRQVFRKINIIIANFSSLVCHILTFAIRVKTCYIIRTGNRINLKYLHITIIINNICLIIEYRSLSQYTM